MVSKPKLTRERALAELMRRQEFKTLVDEVCFDKQLAFIRDPAKRKAVICPRRAGKSVACGLQLLETALAQSCDCLHVAMSKDTAERDVWRDVIQAELIKRGIKHKYQTNKKTVTIEHNGSTIKFHGLDSSPAETEKLRGGHYKLVVIDECQSISQDIRYIVNSVLAPAIAQEDGTVILAGTPGMVMGENYWWRVTMMDADGNWHPEREAGWSLHQWAAYDNPHFAEQYAKDCARLAGENPNYRLDPRFIREYMGHWVLDQGHTVYRFSPARNVLGNSDADLQLKANLLTYSPNFTYLIGVDFGYNDPSAIVIGAYNSVESAFYIVKSERVDAALMSVLGDKIADYCRHYRVDRVVVDTGGGGKLIAESLRDQYQLPIVPADKQGLKGQAQARMNSDFLAGKIKVVEEYNRLLIKEWSELHFDRRAMERGQWVETQSRDNHLADAALYAHRDSLHHFSKPAPEPTGRQLSPDAQKRLAMVRERNRRATRRMY